MFGEVLRRTFTAERTDSSLGLVAARARRAVHDSVQGLHRAPRRRGANQFARARPTSMPASASVHVRTRRAASACRGLRDGLVLPACAFRESPGRVGPRSSRRRNQPPPRRLSRSTCGSIGPVTSSTFVGLPGRAVQWVFDKRALFGESTSHLSLVSSGAVALVNRSNQELVDLALDELKAALPLVRSATLRRAVVVREKRATFSVAPGQPARPQTRTASRACSSPATGSIRACPLRSRAPL